MTSMAKWFGSLYFANGWAHYQGPASDGAYHAHFLHQLIYSDKSPSTVFIKDGETLTGTQLSIPSNLPHRMQVYLDDLDILYIEPSLYRAAPTDMQTLEDWTGFLSEPKTNLIDPRIERAQQMIDDNLHGKIYAKDIAESAGLSVSHFNTLLQQSINIPLRRYVLWRRLIIAGFTAIDGGDLTAAAHAAGFSDSAHLTRTMRETFGVSPSNGLQSIKITIAPDIVLPKRHAL